MTDTCRKYRGSPILKPAIDGPFSEPDGTTVVKTVAIASSQFNNAQQADLQTVENKRQISRVFTGDPLSPRQFPANAEDGLFSSTYVSMSCGRPVEACWPLLKPVALGSSPEN